MSASVGKRASGKVVAARIYGETAVEIFLCKASRDIEEVVERL